MVARAGGNWAVASSREAGDTPEAMPIPGAAEDVCQPDPKNRYPQWKATLGMQPGGRMISPSSVQPKRQMDSPSPVQPKQQVTFKDTSLDSSPEMTLKSADWSWQVEGGDSPSPSSDLDKTTEMVDLTQPMEDDNCFSLSSNLDETVDWSQPARGDLGDPHV